VAPRMLRSSFGYRGSERGRQGSSALEAAGLPIEGVIRSAWTSAECGVGRRLPDEHVSAKFHEPDPLW
jgi:hypothetical protein